MVNLRKTLAVLLVLAGLAAILRPLLAERKQAHWTRLALLQIQQGLQSHLVEKEHYPMLNDARGGDLVEFLLLTGHLAKPPVNPWTMRPYGDSTNDTDRLRYNSTGDFKNFELRVLPDGPVLDHQSGL